MTENIHHFRCGFCGISIDATARSAAMAGWFATFWVDGKNQSDRPACPGCSNDHLKYDKSGDEFVVRKGHAKFLVH